MNNQFNFSFNCQSFKGEKGWKYAWEGRQYLLCSTTKNNYLSPDEQFTHLLIPDDNSLLANYIRNNPEEGEFFSLPLSDLKFLPKLFKENKTLNSNAFLVKNTSQIKKITEKEFLSPQTLTFKVKSQRKIRQELLPDLGTYKHCLEIEPFSLGLEGWPEISKITFAFGYASLMKTWLYNHKILEESAGKTFTMKVNWLFRGKSNNELLFSRSDQFDLDSFKEKTAEDNSKNPSKPETGEKQKNGGLSNNIKLVIIGGILVTLILIAIIAFAKKKKKIVKENKKVLKNGKSQLKSLNFWPPL